jgi:hypothetical protein
VLNLTNIVLVVEIRYAPASILFKGINATETAVSASYGYTIDNYYD